LIKKFGYEAIDLVMNKILAFCYEFSNWGGERKKLLQMNTSMLVLDQLKNFCVFRG
jgi:hypothetical protein